MKAIPRECVVCGRREYATPAAASRKECRHCGSQLHDGHRPVPAAFTLPKIPERDRFQICQQCEHFGTHRRGSETLEGCGLLSRPCRVDQLRRDSRWTGPPGKICFSTIQQDLPTFPRGKVGFLATCYMPIGGTETWHQSLIPRLDSVAGFVCTNHHLAKGNFSLLGCKSGIGWEAAEELASKVDVLVVWGVGSELSRLFQGQPNRPRVISVSHSDGQSDWTREFMLQQAPFTDWCVYLCPSGADSIPESHRARSTLIPNGPDPARIQVSRGRDRTRAKLGVSPGEKLLVVASRLSREKRLDVLMQAVEQLGPGWQLRIAGSASQSEAEHAKQLHSFQTDRVKIVPPVAEPGDLLAAADGYLANSDYEGYGLAVAEAMLAGVPVISTRVGLLESWPGFARLVPSGATAEAWAEQVAMDFESAADQKKRAALSQKTMRDTQSVQCFASQWQRAVSRFCSPGSQ